MNDPSTTAKPLPNNKRLRLGLLLTSTALISPTNLALSQNLPTGARVSTGTVSIAQPSTNRLNITQTSPNAVVNWQSFSVGQGASVAIQQPTTNSALLNRVTGETPSTVAGSITSNGQVYLINPNGIAITSTGAVNVGGGFVASTLGLSDADFMSGRRSFIGNGKSAAVNNEGVITVGRGGYAALIGGTVSNSGQIAVPTGKVALGAGEAVTLDFSGDGFLQVATPSSTDSKEPLIQNTGSIRAEGGSVIISAATARDAARNAVNISGTVEATSVEGRNGAIVISGGEGGKVKISGKIDASSKDTSGGSIKITGEKVKLKAATVDASGATGGGTINIGGSFQGEGPLQQAQKVKIDKGTSINADATQSGNGGDIVVWAILDTQFDGNISARGGPQSGNGGNAEVSGKSRLTYNGFANLSAAKGAFGNLLLDPYNVTISNAADANTNGFIATGNDSVINTTTLQAALEAANVTVSTGSSGTQSGNITINSDFSWYAPTKLTLNAAGAIGINSQVTSEAGSLMLNANPISGISSTGLVFGPNGALNFGGSDPTGDRMSLNNKFYKLVYSINNLDDIDGMNALSNYQTSVYGSGLTGNYALAQNIDATGITYTQPLIGAPLPWNLYTNFNPTTRAFQGSLNGLGHTITGLTINAPSVDYVGLIAYLGRPSSGTVPTVSSVGMLGASVTGSNYVGALIADVFGGAIENSYSTGNVYGRQNVGGLVGYLTGTAQSSFSAVNVSGPSNASHVGGLIGATEPTSSVSKSYSTGSVTGNTSVGGLIGFNQANLSQTFATGLVQGGSRSTSVGGLVGSNRSIISNSFAQGNVSGADFVGGLTGDNQGTITSSYASGIVTGASAWGGLAGSSSGTVNSSVWNATATGTSARTGFNLAPGTPLTAIQMQDLGLISTS